MKEVVIIPARGGSKGIPDKNVALLCGKPLLAHTIEQALNSQSDRQIFVSTDNGRIADVAREYGATVVWRPKCLSGDSDPSEWALQHVMDDRRLETWAIIMLQCTSPIRKAKDIDNALDLFFFTEADSLFSVSPFHNFIWEGRTNPRSINYDYRNRPMRQEMPLNFFENGSIYIMTPKQLKQGNRLGGRVVLYEMDRWAGIDINTQEDLELATWVMENNKSWRNVK